MDDFKEYPSAVCYRRAKKGSIVHWNAYATIAEAVECSDAARHNAEVLRGRGVDFGIEYPGNIHKISELSKVNAGLYEVCVC